MGYEVERFIESVNAELICEICSDVLEDPMECSVCQTNFCKTCIEDWSKRRNECPKRCKLALQKPHRFLKQILGNLKIYCQNKNDGCEAVINLENLVKHENDECLFKRVKCRYLDCNVFLAKNIIEEHEKDCVKRTIACGDCGEEFKYIDLDSHSCVKFLAGIVQTLSQISKENEIKIFELERKMRENGIDQNMVHPGVICNNCHDEPIVGTRNVCLDCQNYNLCWKCKALAKHPHNNFFQLARAGEHEGVTCDGCQITPLRGIRFNCKICENFDFCHDCKLTIPHNHDFNIWAPYFIFIRPVGEIQVAFRTGDIMIRTFEIENLGNEPIKDIFMNCVAGESCIRSYGLSFNLEIPSKTVKILTIKEKITKVEPGSYLGLWRLSTMERRAYFGPEIKIEIMIIE
ncbi:RNF151_2 [Blepharisma stoltei]|uniref:Uncharacterized protein n=1 Tax=Blepharisma stoltei TaxID=1481888 RepID=A0AAU9KG03_9CILI|nr:unnamed protein product [Blepharisma stoltei]